MSAVVEGARWANWRLDTVDLVERFDQKLSRVGIIMCTFSVISGTVNPKSERLRNLRDFR